MYLSKVFSCDLHDLLIVKFADYVFQGNFLKYVNPYLKKNRPCIRKNNIYNYFHYIISGLPHGWRAGPVSFDWFLNSFFNFNKNVTARSFYDSNTSCALAKIELNLELLISESKDAAKWFCENKIIVNPYKRKVIKVTNNKLENIPAHFPSSKKKVVNLLQVNETLW